MNSSIIIQNVIDKFYEIISGMAGEERCWDEFKTLFFSEDSSLTSIRYNADNKCITKRQDVDSYIVGLNNFLKANDFYEYGFNYEVTEIGRIANVYSEYAAKRKKEDMNIVKRGVNFIQLIHNGQSWKIHSMLWQDQ